MPYDRTLWRRLHSPASVCLIVWTLTVTLTLTLTLALTLILSLRLALTLTLNPILTLTLGGIGDFRGVICAAARCQQEPFLLKVKA